MTANRVYKEVSEEGLRERRLSPSLAGPILVLAPPKTQRNPRARVGKLELASKVRGRRPQFTADRGLEESETKSFVSPSALT